MILYLLGSTQPTTTILIIKSVGQATPDKNFYIKVLEINNLSLVIHSYIFIMLLYFCQAMPDLLFIK